MGEPPLRARLHWYKLTPAEFALLTAMCEHCSDGSTVWAAIPRLAAYSKLTERTVQYLIRGLSARGVLSQLAPANGAKRRPATYRVNEAALEEDPRMSPYRIHRQQLPLTGIQRRAIPGEPISDPVQPVHRSGATVSPDPVQPLHPILYLILELIQNL